ncbi:predicted protein [Sclerotinia sclerotiorum 1980 UF-70]|uniref:Uncharacterized protein n=1 Tax=Sclerotinia sclerotiorum (strain ATCC 18683 / 1980 / Ss-1) TaxID=665079 RepID=A7ECZ8_SCLS1|nr:predicted protein [Sclerotinia sclerotiorum 1980 UF-70]EDO00714.1 predicted protein [Sclerotinia sclerotiorum 1980 UF-70]
MTGTQKWKRREVQYEKNAAKVETNSERKMRICMRRSEYKKE